MGASRAQTLDDARALQSAGRLKEALVAYRRIAERELSADPATAGTARNNACVILMNMGDLHAASNECAEALRLRRAASDPRGVARTLNNLGLVQQRLAEYDSAHKFFEEALALNRTRGDLPAQAINLANLGVLATESGAYAKALDYHRAVVELAGQSPGEPWASEQLTLARINEAVVFERLGAFREALQLDNVVLRDASALDASRRAALEVNVGVVYRNLGDPVRALEAFQSAEATYLRLGDTAALANVAVNVGLASHLNLDRPAEAEAAYRKAVRLAEASGDRSEEIVALSYLGRFLLDAKHIGDAREVFERALRASEAAGSTEGRWTALEGLGRVAAARGDLDGALRALEEAIGLIEEVSAQLKRSSLREGFFGQERSVYAAAVEALHRLAQRDPGGGHDRRAFEIVQRAKARALLDALGRGARRGRPLDAGAAAALRPRDTLVEYFVGETQLFAWVLHEGRISMHALGAPGPTLDAVGDVHRALAHGETPPRERLEDLSRVLLGAFGPLPSGHLRIAPDGRLWYLPFEVLSSPDAPEALVVETTTVSYLPSGSALGWLQHHDEAPPLGLIGLGDPLLPKAADGQPTPASLLVSRFHLGPLPAAAAELRAIERWIPGRSAIRTGAGATEDALRSLVPGGARVLHLVSHTVLDEERGRGAAILLTPGNDSDGLLHPEEIASLEIPTNLTVLAACRTALAPEAEGSALATLSGAFLAAGSSAVVATLWDVDDQAARVFMEQFYYQLHLGLTPADALREAKRKLLAHPQWGATRLWAAYVFVGDAAPVAPPPRPWLGRLAIAGAALLALVAALLFHRHRSAVSTT